MALATLEDVQRVLDSVPPSGTGRIRIGSDGAISTEDAGAILDAIEGQIDAILGFAPAVSAFTKEIHAKLTGYHVWIHVVDLSRSEGKIPEYVKEWKAWADKMLEMAKEGDLTIPPAEDDDAVQLAAHSSLIRSVEDEPVLLVENDWAQVKSPPIVKNSEKVRTDKYGGGELCVRGTDYLINWPQGELKLIPTSTKISSGDTVYIAYTHIEDAVFRKIPQRVQYDDRGGAPDFDGLFRGR